MRNYVAEKREIDAQHRKAVSLIRGTTVHADNAHKMSVREDLPYRLRAFWVHVGKFYVRKGGNVAREHQQYLTSMENL